MSKGIFITGTDTDVGKTWVGIHLAKYLYKKGIPLKAFKPVESGCKLIAGKLFPADANQYFLALNQSQALEEICQIRLKQAISPALAAQNEGVHISSKEIAESCATSNTPYVIIEGAGGIYSPICHDGLNIDVAKHLKLPLLLVAEDKLGCINHILLTLAAAKQAKLEVCAIVLNQKDKSIKDANMRNADELNEHLSIPIIQTIDENWLTELSELLIS